MRYSRLLESGMELTRAERQIDYVSDSGDKNWSTFLKKPGWDRIRIRLFVRKVEKDPWDFRFSGRFESRETWRCGWWRRYDFLHELLTLNGHRTNQTVTYEPFSRFGGRDCPPPSFPPWWSYGGTDRFMAKRTRRKWPLPPAFVQICTNFSLYRHMIRFLRVYNC